MLSELFGGKMTTAKKLNVRRIANNFDKRCEGKITSQAFLHYFDFMDFISLDNQKEDKNAKLSERRLKVQAIIQHPFYDGVMNVLNCLNLFSILAKDFLDNHGATEQEIHAWIWIQLAISWFILCELFFIFYGYGIINAFKRRNHVKFEIAFQIFILVAFVPFISSNNYNPILRELEIVAILRSFRLMKLFNEVRQWKVIIRTIEAMISPFFSLLLVTFTLFLIFSIIGDRAFGGHANMNNEAIFTDASIPNTYVHMNFNDLFSSFVTLFALMVVNNWFVIANLFVVTSGTVWARVYFVVFYTLSVVIVVNILIAFVIDMYLSVDSLNQQEAKRKQNRELDPFDDDTATNVSQLNKSQNICEEQEESDEMLPFGPGNKSKTVIYDNGRINETLYDQSRGSGSEFSLIDTDVRK